jgi:hypothetical protein
MSGLIQYRYVAVRGLLIGFEHSLGFKQQGFYFPAAYDIRISCFWVLGVLGIGKMIPVHNNLLAMEAVPKL